MDDTGTTIEDALTKARRDRRRLLIGGGITGSLMMTLPSRRVLASKSKKKQAHGSLWCSFCNAKKGKGSVSHTPVTNQCGDAPTTWQKYTKSYTSNDVPDNWSSLLNTNFETYFPRPTGFDLYISGTKQSSSKHPTFLQCINGTVSYQETKNNKVVNQITTAYAQQAACGYFNSLYYNCNGISYFYSKQSTNVRNDFVYKSSNPTGQNTVATTYKNNYNLD